MPPTKRLAGLNGRRCGKIGDLGNCQEGDVMADRGMIRQTLVELMEADTGEKYADLEDDKNLREDLGLDSVDVVSIVSQIERKFRIRMSQQELEKLVTVGDLLTLLESKIDAPPAAVA